MKAEPIPDRSRQLVTARDRFLCVRCAMKGTDWHHRRSRSVRDAHTHDVCNGVLLCRTCHTWCHANPYLARASGLIVSRYVAEPGRIPVTTVLGTMMLDCSGGYLFV